MNSICPMNFFRTTDTTDTTDTTIWKPGFKAASCLFVALKKKRGNTVIWRKKDSFVAIGWCAYCRCDAFYQTRDITGRWGVEPRHYSLSHGQGESCHYELLAESGRNSYWTCFEQGVKGSAWESYCKEKDRGVELTFVFLFSSELTWYRVFLVPIFVLWGPTSTGKTFFRCFLLSFVWSVKCQPLNFFSLL